MNFAVRSDRSEGLEAEDGGAAGIGFFEVEGEVEGPVVEVVGIRV